ncbi:phosphotransferase enzyme family protein [Chryseobacterium sp. c4a]|uniref:phosphotransferase enzyme family protein n=1 Tax=Chryseobacterium sp. c4a TaxID=1573582 RepID=UPI00135B78E2|nr:aminoglycoside phosphotransferase family protein [Chryseobacterium sp. c4a]
MIQIEKLKEIINHYYPMVVTDITPIEPGWAALAYKVYADDGKMFFLKVYDKKRSSIASILDRVPVYLFFIGWLNSDAFLEGKISKLVNTKDDQIKVEDENYLYIIMDYIEGYTVGERNLTQEQIRELAEIIARLHAIVPPKSPYMEPITEKFEHSWLNTFRISLTSQFRLLNQDIQNIVEPYLVSLVDQIDELKHQGEQLSKSEFSFVFCHTDIHNWNMIANEDDIYLIDWEGIKYAPAEADLFGLYNESYFSEFLKYYQKIHPSYQMNMELLRYYMISRHITDLWEGIEQLQFDTLSSDEYNQQLAALKDVCEENAAFINSI